VIIDIHTHLAAPGLQPDADEMLRMRALARHAGIEKAVALGNLIAVGGPHPTPEQIHMVNENTLRAMHAQPDFFIGFCYMNAANPEDFSLAEIERCVVRGGMRGLKFWVAVLATDKRHDALLARAQDLGIPILYHAWYKAFDQGSGESTPAQVADLARRFPKVQIVMAHLTGDGERGVQDILDTPNVLIDTSGGQPESGLVEYAVRRLGAERVIFGSDWPIRDFGVQIGRVKGGKLSSRDAELVFRGNAARILGLKP